MTYYTITTEDVGKPYIQAFRQAWPVQDFLGRVLPGDVGKRVYKRGDILQVENVEQYEARMAALARPGFKDDVAWLQFIHQWERRNLGGQPLTTPMRDKSLMRIAFDWARANPRDNEQAAQSCQALHNHNAEEYDAEMATLRCECSSGCGLTAVLHLFRVTGWVHETPIHDSELAVFCEPCGDKALESGAFCAGDDMLEPHHGPGCGHAEDFGFTPDTVNGPTNE